MVPLQKCLRQDNEEGLFPGSNGSCQKHQKHSIGLLENRSFDLSSENNQLLAEERVFCHEFGLASGKVYQHPQDKSGVAWFCPADKAVVERLKTKASQPFDKGENPMHSVRYPFVKMSD